MDYIDEPTTSQRQQTMSQRMFERNLPYQPMQMYLDTRPAMSKYAWLPVYEDHGMKPTIPLVQQPTFVPSKMFNPGNDRGPWSGYASNIQVESELKNQMYALQSCPQASYIPSSSSTLYKYNVQTTGKGKAKADMLFPDLFDSHVPPPTASSSHYIDENVGFALFNNATRQQTKNIFS